MEYTFYNDIGEIRFNYSGTDPDLQLQDGHSDLNYIEGSFGGDNYYIAEGMPVIFPTKPSIYSYFNYTTKEWVLDTELQLTSETYIIRQQRDILLKEMDAIISNPIRWNAMTEIERSNWTNYRQLLLDVPQQEGFPLNVTWPEVPQ